VRRSPREEKRFAGLVKDDDPCRSEYRFEPNHAAAPAGSSAQRSSLTAVDHVQLPLPAATAPLCRTHYPQSGGVLDLTDQRADDDSTDIGLLAWEAAAGGRGAEIF
jgi:hypothetical protein